MGIIFFGQAKTPIGVDEVLMNCPSCEKATYSDLMVESNYFHVYGIPIFPIDKTCNLICQECNLKRYGLPFEKAVLPNFEEIKQKFRHPVRTYISSLILAGLILGAIIFKKI